jgi:hypothetical protein
MILKHGVATSDDVSAPKEPLSRALTSLSNLPTHMDLFLLASQRLTLSGQGETDFNYFKLFLETVLGFRSVALSMPGYYAQFPAILQQILATLFPYLEKMRDHLVRSDPTSPFSKGNQVRAPKAKKAQRPPARTPKWANRPSTPALHCLHVGAPTGQSRMLPSLHHRPTTYPTMACSFSPKISGLTRQWRLWEALWEEAPTGTRSPVCRFPLPPANAYLATYDKPRQFYCWLHAPWI